MFKEMIIWIHWKIHKHLVTFLSIFIVTAFLFCFVLASAILSTEGRWLMILFSCITAALWISETYLFYSCIMMRGKNWRIKFEKIKKVREKHPEYNKIIGNLVATASRFKRSQDVVDWLELWKNYKKSKEKLAKMEERIKTLPKLIQQMQVELRDLPALIKLQKKEIEKTIRPSLLGENKCEE